MRYNTGWKQASSPMGYTLLWVLLGMVVHTFLLGRATGSTTGSNTSSPVGPTKEKKENKENSVRQEQLKMKAIQKKMQEALTAAQGNIETTKAQFETTQTQLAKKLETTKTQLEKELETTKAQLETTKSQLDATKAKLDARAGSSTFIRWGRSTCPGKTTRVYTGVVAGKHHNRRGGGTNFLCLTESPRWDNTALPKHYSEVFRTEYNSIPGHGDHVVPCSLCLALQSATIMLPATLSCPQGWTSQYSGHLVTALTAHYATEHVCVDGSPENHHPFPSDEQSLLYYSVFRCGAQPCHGYDTNAVLTCVVCSK